jgi:hypothetical protein
VLGGDHAGDRQAAAAGAAAAARAARQLRDRRRQTRPIVDHLETDAVPICPSAYYDGPAAVLDRVADQIAHRLGQAKAIARHACRCRDPGPQLRPTRGRCGPPRLHGMGHELLDLDELSRSGHGVVRTSARPSAGPAEVFERQRCSIQLQLEGPQALGRQLSHTRAEIDGEPGRCDRPSQLVTRSSDQFPAP